jgi:tRNA A-37 threonylcarbamoyl transferase component Bud32
MLLPPTHGEGDAMSVSPCANCGTVPEADARFCGGCGQRLGSTPTTKPRDANLAHPRRAAGAPLADDPVVRAPPAETLLREGPRHQAPALIPADEPAWSPPAARESPAPFPAPRPAPAPREAAWSPGALPLRAEPFRPGAPPPPGPLVGASTLAEDPAIIAARVGVSLDKLIGRTLNNRYLVLRKIGEGGFGAVFEGTQVATGREVALKILHPHNVSDSTVVARFRREAEACSRLRNAHTVTIYDFDETPDGILYLVMELVRGRSLQQVQKSEGPLPPARSLNILNQIADALGEAHEQGLVHRDMKPENVMVESRDGEDFVKVLDFGIAKIISGDAAKKGPALTAFGQTVGTLEFMSPEQLRGQALDGRSDIYAIGIMAYEMLTGELPFGEIKAPTDIIHFHLQQTPPPPSRMRPEARIPAAVDELVLRMVAKSASDRHADAVALRANLEETLSGLDSRAARREMLRMVAVIGALALLVTGIVVLFSR